MNDFNDRNSDKNVKFLRNESFILDANAMVLQEGLTSANQNLERSKIEADVKQYGTHVEVSDLIDLTRLSPALTECTELIGEQLGNVIERVTRNAMFAAPDFDEDGRSAKKTMTNTAGLLNKEYYDKMMFKYMRDSLRTYRCRDRDVRIKRLLRGKEGYHTIGEIVVKALTVDQPYAQFLAIGEKAYETRSWGTNYRGTVFIHAGKRLPRAGSEEDAFVRELLRGSSRLSDVSLEELPRGMIIGCGVLSDCIKMDQEFCAALEDTREAELGFFEPGRYAWMFEEVVLLDESDYVPIPGKLSLWNLRI